MNSAMKCLKIWAVVLIFAMFTSNVFAVDVYVSNHKLSMDVPPVIESGRTLVPLRAIFEAFGADVQWDPVTQTVTGTKDGKEIKLQVNNMRAYINGMASNLEVPAKIISGRTMVPARFVAESMGANVGWDGCTRSVLVNSKAPYGNYQVLRVVDGDTIEVNFDGKVEDVRFIGVDTPESVHPDESRNTEFGIVASNFTKSQLQGQTVGLELDVEQRDQYGRLLAYVWVNGQMYNKTLLSEGYAKVATYPPNVRYVSDFTALEQQARSLNKGLWGISATSPTVSSGGTSQDSSSSRSGGTTVQTGIDPMTATYIANSNTHKFHYSSCRYADDIAPRNRVGYNSREEAIADGYVPCKVCNP